MARRYFVVKGKKAKICKKWAKNQYYYSQIVGAIGEGTWTELEIIKNPDLVMKLKKGIKEA